MFYTPILSTKDGTNIRQFLPRALSQMVSKSKPDKLRDKISQLVAPRPSDNSAESSLNNHIAQIIDEILNSDQRSAQQNISRLKTVAAFFSDAGNVQSGKAIQRLMGPIEHGTDRLFKRSALRMKMATTVDPTELHALQQE